MKYHDKQTTEASIKFNKIDDDLTSILADVEKIANTINFDIICELSDESTIKKQEYYGIYKIDVKTSWPQGDFSTWVDKFKSNWRSSSFGFTPNVKEKRIKCHLNKPLEEWVPIYIGKSKNVSKRVLEHKTLNCDKKTFALKLNGRGESMQGHIFRLSTINLNGIDNYDHIATELENFYRHQLNPIIGNQ